MSIMTRAGWYLLGAVLVCSVATSVSAVDINVDTSQGLTPISAALYGKNNCLSDDPTSPLSAQQWQLLSDAGVMLIRDIGGNNATKYNWERKLTSHPDWYNNVYPHDWDYTATSIEEHLPGVQGMGAFQLIGKAAKTMAYNFDDWNYNSSAWWTGVTNNWAGGGGPTQDGGQVDGDPDLYLLDWYPEDTVAILDHWFGAGGLGLNPNHFRYWSMDNEPEIWSGTHDDVYPTQPPVEDFLASYFETAQQARALMPQIKLLGPVAANEWQWFNWDNTKITDADGSYTWLEYFIKRVGEEQQVRGVRLLDVIDVHFYPQDTDPADILQLHRIWFDASYVYPFANGVKRAGASEWDDSITSEYLFARCRAWLDQYLGPGNGVTFGVTEMGIHDAEPSVTAVWYASTLGTFADEGVEVFTPWDWKPGMWEVLHLFTRYHQRLRVDTSSSAPQTVSAYAAISSWGDTLSIILVNRSLTQSQDVTVSVQGFTLNGTDAEVLTLADLPTEETFVSDSDNALSESTASPQGNTLTLVLEPLSVTAVIARGEQTASLSPHRRGRRLLGQ